MLRMFELVVSLRMMAHRRLFSYGRLVLGSAALIVRRRVFVG